ncbi:MAG: ATP phosphoribosyltransferase regulatory subunit [Lachnospiraceae bacterium]|nr:ATP phosphoribosyltransferase regulatory subunit [Lachnospiraceae bacterium]
MAFIPEGVKDTLCKESEVKDKVIHSLKELFRSYGYRKIETPTFEYYDTFSEIKNTVDKDKTLKIIDSDGKILVLRPDVTTPIVRSVLSNFKDRKDYLKFYYNVNVFFKSDALSDGKKEMTQVGIEFIGGNRSFCDSEAIALAILSLKETCGQGFQVDIGQTAYLYALLNGIKDKEQLKKAISNKNMIALGDLLESMEIDENIKQALSKVPYLYGSMEEIEKEAIICNEGPMLAMNSLKEIYAVLKQQGLESFVSFDLGMMQELNYYTGVIFKGYVEGYGKVVLSGGRYGNLFEEGDDNFSGVGFGIDMDSLLESAGKKTSIKSDYIVVGSDVDKVIKKSTELRKKGYIVEGLLKDMDYKKLEGKLIDLDVEGM